MRRAHVLAGVATALLACAAAREAYEPGSPVPPVPSTAASPAAQGDVSFAFSWAPQPGTEDSLDHLEDAEISMLRRMRASTASQLGVATGAVQLKALINPLTGAQVMVFTSTSPCNAEIWGGRVLSSLSEQPRVTLAVPLVRVSVAVHVSSSGEAQRVADQLSGYGTSTQLLGADFFSNPVVVAAGVTPQSLALESAVTISPGLDAGGGGGGGSTATSSSGLSTGTIGLIAGVVGGTVVAAVLMMSTLLYLRRERIRRAGAVVTSATAPRARRGGNRAAAGPMPQDTEAAGPEYDDPSPAPAAHPVVGAPTAAQPNDAAATQVVVFTNSASTRAQLSAAARANTARARVVLPASVSEDPKLVIPLPNGGGALAAPPGPPAAFPPTAPRALVTIRHYPHARALTGAPDGEDDDAPDPVIRRLASLASTAPVPRQQVVPHHHSHTATLDSVTLEVGEHGRNASAASGVSASAGLELVAASPQQMSTPVSPAR